MCFDLKTSSKLCDSFSLNVQLSVYMVRICNIMQCLDIRLEAASGMQRNESDLSVQKTAAVTCSC